MTKNEALKLALEALTSGVDAQVGRVVWTEYDSCLIAEAITAIEQALAAPEQEPDPIGDAQDRLIAELATQPAQEPVAWISENAGLYHGKPDESLNPLPLYLAPPPCPTCEALARTVMMDQTAHDNFKPDWDAMAVMVEEQQRMAKRIVELEALLERQTARIVDLQTHIENFDGEDR
jgi:hypothetical protein